MNDASPNLPSAIHFELRYIGLFNVGRGYVFPCDAAGHVEIDDLSDRGRDNYFYARTSVGREFSVPVVRPAS